MIRLAISVEGQTEEAFVKDVLAAHLRPMEVESYPILLGRARGGGAGGGNVGVDRLVSDMVRLRRSFDAVTSLVDFYGFRGKEDRTVEQLERHLAQEIRARMPDAAQTFPYVQKYEFEGLLFSDATAFRAIGPEADGAVETLARIRRQFATPEDVNDDPCGAPSKRIARVVAGYRKRLHGPLVARAAGLAKIRAECSRFRAWLTRLEGLAAEPRGVRGGKPP